MGTWVGIYLNIHLNQTYQPHEGENSLGKGCACFPRLCRNNSWLHLQVIPTINTLSAQKPQEPVIFTVGPWIASLFSLCPYLTILPCSPPKKPHKTKPKHPNSKHQAQNGVAKSFGVLTLVSGLFILPSKGTGAESREIPLLFPKCIRMRVCGWKLTQA